MKEKLSQKMPNISINQKAAITNCDNIVTRLCEVQNCCSELWQDLLKYGYDKPLTPEFINALLDQRINLLKESCKQAIQITLECRKMIKDKTPIRKKGRSKNGK